MCHYCGLEFGGPGYSPDSDSRFCCCGCYLVSRIVGAAGEEGLTSWIVVRLGIGAFLAMNVMMISLVLYSVSPGDLGQSAVRGLKWAMLILSTPAIIILGGPFVRAGLRDITRFRLGTDVLIATGSVAAYAVSARHVVALKGAVYFDTATMLLLIVTLGRLLEASAKSSTSRAIHDMVALTPETARVLRESARHGNRPLRDDQAGTEAGHYEMSAGRDGDRPLLEEVDIQVGDLSVGDVMLVKPGEHIPADGKVVSGSCTVEEAAFTGEAYPRSCSPGDRVYGGSVDRDGLIRVEAEAVGADTLAARIEDLVLRARRERAPVEHLAERVAGVFVPFVWLVSAGAAGYWTLVGQDAARGGMSALAVLVVACPCALGLATPMATCLAIGAAARRGALIRSGEVLERLHRVKRVLFDKTGTLTSGSMSVAMVRTAPGVTEAEVLRWAAPLEAASGHLIGEAIAARAQEECFGSESLPKHPKSHEQCFGSESHPKHPDDRVCVSEVQMAPGMGVSGSVTIDGKARRVTVGSFALLLRDHTLPPELAPSADDEALSTAYVGWSGKVQGVIGLSDSPRPEAHESISELASRGIRTAVVSGDREGPTLRLADELRIKEAFSEFSPEDKAALAAKGGAGTAMVGDGINDAPALAAADVGIAVGSGTDLARASSDVTLLGDDLLRIAELIDLSRHTYRIIRQNLAFSFGYNAIAIVLACMGYVHPLIAALAMFASSLCVISNSLRIRRLSDRPRAGA